VIHYPHKINILIDTLLVQENMVLKWKLHTISLHSSLFHHKLINCSISSPESQTTSRSITDIQCKVCEVPSGILIYKMQDKTHYHLKESKENVRGEKGANINYSDRDTNTTTDDGHSYHLNLH